MPAGVRTRGRFAASRLTDPGTDLLDRSDPAVERELFDRCSASARHWGNRLGVGTEDLLQDTAVEFYATLARQRGADGPQPGLNGRTVKPATPMANPGGWIHRIAYNIAARRVAGTNSSADLSALREYRTRVQDAENRSGRELSPLEADRLSDEIRMTRPPRRRPTPGFHRKVRTVSTEALGPDWDTPADANPAEVGEFPAHTAGATAENLLTDSGSPGVRPPGSWHGMRWPMCPARLSWFRRSLTRGLPGRRHDWWTTRAARARCPDIGPRTHRTPRSPHCSPRSGGSIPTSSRR